MSRTCLWDRNQPAQRLGADLSHSLACQKGPEEAKQNGYARDDYACCDSPAATAASELLLTFQKLPSPRSMTAPDGFDEGVPLS